MRGGTGNSLAGGTSGSTNSGIRNRSMMPPVVTTTSRRQQQQQRTGGSKSTSTKITIKPFARPPKLPDNYYEETSGTILKGTLQFLEQRNVRQQDKTSNEGTNDNSNSSSSCQYSLQSAYNSTVHLVSHQYGGRLFADLVQTLQAAAEQVLERSHCYGDGNEVESSLDTSSHVMEYIVEQYAVYTDYLMLCKHVLTPLDRTWQWQDATQRAIPVVTPSTTTTTTIATTTAFSSSTFTTNNNNVRNPKSTSANSHTDSGSKGSSLHPLQNIWQVGLTCFLRRLQFLGMDQALYKQWLSAFLQDWDAEGHLSRTGAASTFIESSTTSISTGRRRQTLQQVWYLWQDLGLLSQLPIHRDLERYWSSVSNDWANNCGTNSNSTSASYNNQNSASTATTTNNNENNGKYPITQFIMFCYEKHLQCYSYRQWLPVVWLWNILDNQLFQPHIMPQSTTTPIAAAVGISNTAPTFASPVPLLLQDCNLHPILHEALSQHHHSQRPDGFRDGRINNSTRNIKWNTVQILWMLAGRLHDGQRAVATAIQRFARIQGLQCVQGGGGALTGDSVVPSSSTSIANKKNPPGQVASSNPSPNNNNQAPTTNNTNVIQDLLELQDSLSSMILTLPITTVSSSSSSSTSSPSSQGGGVVLLPNSPLPAANFYNSGNTYSTTVAATNSIISLKSVWEEVVNVETQPSIAEQLAKFLDGILKSNKKIDFYQNQNNNSVLASSDSTANASSVVASSQSSTAWLHRIVMGLFVPLASKDVFEAFYKKDLAKRLLWGRVVSMDIEKQICSLLKAECGAGYTSKMEGMFQDIEWSRESMAVYKESTMNNNPSNEVYGSHNSTMAVEMEVQVLTAGYWPIYPQYPNLHLPMSLQNPLEHFTNHYKTKYQGRRMTWQYALGHCVVRANGFNKTYDLIVSLCQALTLLQFTSSPSTLKSRPTTLGQRGECWTLPELQRATGLDDRDEMERILQSLSLGKEGTRILKKIDFEHREISLSNAQPSGNTSPSQSKQQIVRKKTGNVNQKLKTRSNVDDKDIFVVNDKFDSNGRRIRINNILMKETKEEHDKTVEGISRDRLYLIDAVLVRIMKARKSILHQQLLPQVMEQIKVPALPADIKKRIESLIEREYMERDAKDRNRYNYLA